MIDGLLVDLAERQRLLGEALDRARVDEDRAKLLASEYEERLAAVKDERKRIRQEALDEARGILDGAKSLVEETVRELRAKEAARDTIKAAREKVEKRRAEVARAAEDERTVERVETGRRPGSLAPGMRVRVRSLGREGELVSLPDGEGQGARARPERGHSGGRGGPPGGGGRDSAGTPQGRGLVRCTGRRGAGHRAHAARDDDRRDRRHDRQVRRATRSSRASRS